MDQYERLNWLLKQTVFEKHESILKLCSFCSGVNLPSSTETLKTTQTVTETESVSETTPEDGDSGAWKPRITLTMYVSLLMTLTIM